MKVRISIGNRDYHHLSRFEIGVVRGFPNINPKRGHCRKTAQLISALIDKTFTGKCAPRPVIELRASLDSPHE
jgi:hypothetical protein